MGVRRLALESLYRAGGRRFIVWDILAGELLPLVGTVNWLVNILNDVLAHAHKQAPQQDVFKTYVGNFCVRHFFPVSCLGCLPSIQARLRHDLGPQTRSGASCDTLV